MRTAVLGLAAGSAVALAAALGAGCGGTEGSNLFGAGSVGGAGSTHATVTSSTTTAGGDTTTGTSTTTSTTTTSSGQTTTSTTTGGGVCSPQAGDDACTMCTKSMCCDTIMACVVDPKCTCWTQCLQQHPNDFQGCFTMCGNPDGPTNDVGSCVQGPCAQACGGGGSTTTTSTTSGGGACAPASGDSACVSCSKMHCCSGVTACSTDTNCQCWAQCLGNGGGNLCSQICGQPDAVTGTLFTCVQQQCQGSCM